MGYEIHCTPETISLRFNTIKPMQVRNLSLTPREGKFSLQFDLVPYTKPLTRKNPSPSSVPQKALTPLIALDPGHGGIDPGAQGVNGVLEKDITLRVARILQKILLKKGYRVLLTRKQDCALRRIDRLEKIEAEKADFFISLHADHNPQKNMRGISIYTLAATASDLESAYLAQRENAADKRLESIDVSSPEVAKILEDLAKREVHLKAEKFVHLFTDILDPKGCLQPKMHRSADFLILRSAVVPSVLIELGCLSNKKDCTRLASKTFLYKISHCIAKTIDKYFSESAL
jgi:N-acetylmuramoyl-L-alanine amidase